MKRFFGERKGENIIVGGDEFFHMKKVLRLQEGEEIIVCLNDENDYFCTIEHFAKDHAVCFVIKTEKNRALPKKRIALFQMMPKKEYFDNILPKAIELGVSEIHFFTSAYTMNKTFKSQRVATQVMTACKQCERSKLVDVDLVKFDDIKTLLSSYQKVIFAYEKEEKMFSSSMLDGCQSIAVIIGNEAGFTSEEADKIKSWGATSISLGNRILRCDTAVVATLSLVGILSGV